MVPFMGRAVAVPTLNRVCNGGINVGGNNGDGKG
jgi:hypothetical protein